jgi:DNA repair protein RecO (recombination protein O)
MPPTFDEGICIRHWDFSETSQTVSLFGRTLGLVRGLAKGARRERGAFDGGIDLLARGSFGVILKPGRELATLTEWDLLEMFPRLRQDLAANQAAFYMADLVGRMLQPEDPHPGLFDSLVRALRVLGTAREDSEPDTAGGAALLMFQWTLLVEAGYQPRLELPVGAEVVEFVPDAGGFVAGALPDGVRWKVRRTTAECLRAVSVGVSVVEAPAVVDRANRLLAAYLRHVLGAEPPTMHLVFGRKRAFK